MTSLTVSYSNNCYSVGGCDLEGYDRGVMSGHHGITAGRVESDRGPVRRAERSSDLSERFARRHSSSYHAFDGLAAQRYQ